MNRREFLFGLGASAAAIALGNDATAGGKKETRELKLSEPLVQWCGTGQVGVKWSTSIPATGHVDWSQDGGTTWQSAWFSRDGLRDANALQHEAYLAGVDEARPLKLRIISRAHDFFQAYKMQYLGEDQVVEQEFKPLVQGGNFSLAVFNDVHSRAKTIPSFLPLAQQLGVTGIILNGDIIDSAGDEKSVNQVIGAAMRRYAQAGISARYVRGNHETRGGFSRSLRAMLPYSEERFYGAATLAGVRFVFLDTGEDKDDEHPVLWGLTDFTHYLAQQGEWLKRELASAEWKNARRRIVVGHIPPAVQIDPAKNKIWRPHSKALRQLLKLLEGNKVDAFIGAHVHRQLYTPKGVATDFPIFTGGGPKSEGPAIYHPSMMHLSFSNNTFSVSLYSSDLQRKFNYEL